MLRRFVIPFLVLCVAMLFAARVAGWWTAELREEIGPFFSIEHFRANLGIYMSMIVGKPGQ